jgi:hypothetical protein
MYTVPLKVSILLLFITWKLSPLLNKTYQESKTSQKSSSAEYCRIRHMGGDDIIPVRGVGAAPEKGSKQGQSPQPHHNITPNSCVLLLGLMLISPICRTIIRSASSTALLLRYIISKLAFSSRSRTKPNHHHGYHFFAGWISFLGRKGYFCVVSFLRLIRTAIIIRVSWGKEGKWTQLDCLPTNVKKQTLFI